MEKEKKSKFNWKNLLKKKDKNENEPEEDDVKSENKPSMKSRLRDIFKKKGDSNDTDRENGARSPDPIKLVLSGNKLHSGLIVASGYPEDANGTMKWYRVVPDTDMEELTGTAFLSLSRSLSLFPLLSRVSLSFPHLCVRFTSFVLYLSLSLPCTPAVVLNFILTHLRRSLSLSSPSTPQSPKPCINHL